MHTLDVNLLYELITTAKGDCQNYIRMDEENLIYFLTKISPGFSREIRI
jgi:hypothetical protein